MSSLLPAIAGGVARALMAFAAGYGVELGNDKAEVIAEGLLAVITVGWTIIEKLRSDRKVKQAAALGYVP